MVEEKMETGMHVTKGRRKIHVPFHGDYHLEDLSDEYLHNLAAGILSHLGKDYIIGNPRKPAVYEWAHELLKALDEAAHECANVDASTLERVKSLAQGWAGLVAKARGE